MTLMLCSCVPKPGFSLGEATISCRTRLLTDWNHVIASVSNAHAGVCSSYAVVDSGAGAQLYIPIAGTAAGAVIRDKYCTPTEIICLII